MAASGQDMGKGRVRSVLFRLGAPAMVSMFFQNLYALVDTMFVGWLGPHPLASMSLCIPLIFISLALGKGLAVGATTLASRARGEEAPDRAAAIIRSVLPLGLVILTPFVLLSLPLVNQTIFSVLGAHEDTLPEIVPYMIWVGPVYPVMGAALICEGIFLSYGDAKTPMAAMIAGNLVNVVLDPFLIFSAALVSRGRPWPLFWAGGFQAPLCGGSWPARGWTGPRSGAGPRTAGSGAPSWSWEHPWPCPCW
jgi:Na+-driven multidrug efflux pump